MKVVIVHRWHGSPSDDWYPWLKRELEKKKIEVIVPKMPDTSKPTIEKWILALSKIPVDKNTYFVGHSIGCQTIIRYLEKYEKKVGGAVFVAGWFKLTNLEPKEIRIARPWIEMPIDFQNVKKATKNYVAIFSDDDPYVPFIENMNMFREKMNAKILVEEKAGHFTEEDEVTKVPYVLDTLMKISK